jgi:spore coat protein CotH
VDFNRYGKARDFHGMTSLALKNEIQDPSFLREALALQVFEAMGFPSPAAALARVTVNDEYWGVYLMTEEIRKYFVAARFGEDSGNIFKYEWNGSWDFSWRGEDPVEYVPLPFEPHSNENDLDPSRLIELVNVINNAPDEELQAALAPFLDARKFLTYIAIENALAESDGFVGDFGMNNFYFYERSDGVFQIIPWDKDNALQEPTWPIFRRTDENVLSRRLFQDVAMQAAYVNAVSRCVKDYVNDRWLLPRLESLYLLIRNSALSDDKKPYTNEEFELAVLGLRGIIRGREPDVQSQLR